MTEKGEKLLILAAGLFLALSMGVVFFVYQLNESIAAVPEDGKEASEDTIGGGYFEAAAGEDADIVIPLPEGKEQFYIEESAGGKKLTVILDEVEEDFFALNKIRGDEEKISRIQLIREQETASLIFTFYHVYEADASFGEGELRLKLTSPMASYEKIIVMDGGSDLFREETEKAFEPYEIKGIFDGDVAGANVLRAECFVSVEEKNGAYGTGNYGERENTLQDKTEIVIYYNDDYFIPEFDSRSLAELFRDYYNEFHDEWTVILVKSDDADLKGAMVPAVRIVYRMPQKMPAETSEDGAAREDSVERLTIDALVLQYGGNKE